MLFGRDCHHSKNKVRLRHCQLNVIAGVSHELNRRATEVSIAKNRSPAICVKISLPDVAPFLPFRCTRRDKCGKRRHKAKAEDRRILRVMARDPARSSTRRQRAVNVSFSACAWRIHNSRAFLARAAILLGLRVRHLAVLLLHLVATVARVAGSGGARSVVAESVLVKHQLLILNRSRKRVGCVNSFA
jgi:hypothetical protein